MEIHKTSNGQWYSALFSHMKAPVDAEIGHVYQHHDVIGTMGATGDVTGPHLHLPVVDGIQRFLWHLADMDPERRDPAKIWPNITQLNYFVCDKDLFGVLPRITTYYMDPTYDRIRPGKNHPAYDVVPNSGVFDNQIFWPRSFEGHLITKGFDPRGYGNWAIIAFCIGAEHE
jgi:hypothetical protein